MQAVGDVDEGGEDNIRRQEALRQSDAADGRVVQRALKPLVRVGVGGILYVNRESIVRGKINCT